MALSLYLFLYILHATVRATVLFEFPSHPAHMAEVRWTLWHSHCCMLQNKTIITSGINGTSYIFPEGAQAIANYPHVREAGGLLFISGTSSRRPDNTHEGVVIEQDGIHSPLLISWMSVGTVRKDIEAQTRAVIQNIQTMLKKYACHVFTLIGACRVGADLNHLVECTTYLVNMQDYSGYNKVWNTFFTGTTGRFCSTSLFGYLVPSFILCLSLSLVPCFALLIFTPLSFDPCFCARQGRVVPPSQ